MLGIVDRADYTGPVKIGIGTEEQHRQLSAIGCERVYSVSELAKGEHDSADPVRMIFRPEDTVVMVQPGIMPLPLMRAVAAMGVAWQVPGHDAVRFASDEDRIAWRQQKPLGLDVPYARKSVGPKPKWPIPTEAQVQLIVKHWHSAQKRAVVVEIVQDMLGADVPDHWVRDQVIKATGSAKRSPQGEGFAALPPPSDATGAGSAAWWVTLGVSSDATEAEIRAAYKAEARKAGGTSVELNAARDAGLASRGAA